MALKSYLEKSINRFNKLENLFSQKSITIICDKLRNETIIDHDVLYYKTQENLDENELLFIFGYDFFLKELEDQEFKKLVNQNHLDFIIFGAYHKLKKSKKKGDKIKISEILNQIQDKEKDSLELHKIIEKVLSLSYYLNWELEKDSNSIENDYFVQIPNNFLIKIKQRFNLDIIEKIYEDKNLFIFLNGKGKLILVLKDKDKFARKDIEKQIIPVIEDLFDIKVEN